MDSADLKSQKIYTTGFAGKRVDALPALLARLEAVLIDIRFTPSKLPLSWSETYLKILLKRRYLHVPALGSRSFRDGKTGIQNLQLGINLIKSLEVDVILICECQEYENCHRRVITEEFNKQGFITKELANWK